MIKDESIFKEFIKDRNLSKSSEKIYYKAFKRYTQTQNLTLQELYTEADNEEEERIRAKNRTIKKRIKNFRQWLIDNKYKPNVIKDYVGKVNTFYAHFEIETPTLPPVQYPREYHIRFDDIPNINHIKTALESTNNLKHKAIILFIASSGSSRDETANLSISDFIKSTNDYHNSTDIKTVLDELEPQDNVIPIFEMIRNKTDFPYYTCCSNEATEMIIKFLKTRDNLKSSDRLFDLAAKSITDMFNRINKNNGWGKIDNYGFFHPHSLRKFHASTIEDISFANFLQGRKSDSITETYFKQNPKRVVEKYLEHLPKLTINKTVVNKIDDDSTKEIKKELADTKERLVKVEEEKANMADEIYERVMKDIEDLPP